MEKTQDQVVGQQDAEEIMVQPLVLVGETQTQIMEQAAVVEHRGQMEQTVEIQQLEVIQKEQLMQPSGSVEQTQQILGELMKVTEHLDADVKSSEEMSHEVKINADATSDATGDTIEIVNVQNCNDSTRNTINILFTGKDIIQRAAFHCLECQRIFSTDKALEKHLKCHTQETVYQCGICQKAYSSKGNLKKHLHLHTAAPKDNRELFQCSVCNKFLKSKARLSKHLASHNEGYVSTLQNSRSRNFDCTVCKKQFYANRDLVKHLNMHSRDMVTMYMLPMEKVQAITDAGTMAVEELDQADVGYQCSKCSSEDVFLSYAAFQEHKKTHKHKREPMICGICGKVVRGTDNMARHQEIHTGSKPYECKVCNNFFSRKDILKNHMKTHDKDETTSGLKRSPRRKLPFTCELCHDSEEKFRTRKLLDAHIHKVHIKKGEFTYSCDVCGKKFRFRNSLRRHMYLHEGNAQYKYSCEHCSAMFYRKDLFEKHISACENRSTSKRDSAKDSSTENKIVRKKRATGKSSGSAVKRRSVVHVTICKKRLPGKPESVKENSTVKKTESKKSVPRKPHVIKKRIVETATVDKKHPCSETNGFKEDSEKLTKLKSQSQEKSPPKVDLVKSTTMVKDNTPAAGTTEQQTGRDRQELGPTVQIKRRQSKQAKGMDKKKVKILDLQNGKKISIQQHGVIEHDLETATDADKTTVCLASNQQATDGDLPYKCDQCSLAFRRKSILNRHALIHGTGDTCYVYRSGARQTPAHSGVEDRKTATCKKANTSGQVKQKAATKSQTSLTCSVCRKSFRSKEALVDHFSSHGRRSWKLKKIGTKRGSANRSKIVENQLPTSSCDVNEMSALKFDMPVCAKMSTGCDSPLLVTQNCVP